MAYWSQQDLEGLLGVEEVRAIFDDDNDGVADPAPLSLVQRMSDTAVDAALATEFPATYPLTNPPDVVVRASLLFGKAYAYARRPEYVKQYGSKPLEEAKANLEQIVTAREYMTSALGTQIAQQPANVGGVAIDNANRLYVDAADGTQNSGDF